MPSAQGPSSSSLGFSPERSSFVDALDVVPIPLCLVDDSHKIRWANALFRVEFDDRYGIGASEEGTRDEFLGRFVEADRDRIRRFLSRRPPGSSIFAATDDGRLASRTVLLNHGPLVPDGGGLRCVTLQVVREVEAQSEEISATLPFEAAANAERNGVSATITSVADTLPIPAWAVDHEGAVVLWNRAAERLLGISRRDAEARGQALLRDIGVRVEPRPGPPRLPDPETEAAIKLVTPDGEVRWIRWFTIGDAWSVRGWRSWGIGLDVTEQYAAFRALQESERRYRDVLKNVDLAGIMVDEQERVLYLNDQLLSMGGWNELALLGLPWRRAFCEGVGATIDADALGKVLSLTPFDGRAEGKLVTRDGDTRILVWTQSLYRDVDGRIVGSCALGTDITEHRRAAERLSAHRDQLEELVDQRSAALAESERRLRDAERLAALGQLSAGVSHDLGNMLLPVRCHLDRIRAESISETQRASLDAVCSGIEFLDHLGEGLEILASEAAPSGGTDTDEFEQFAIRDWWSEVSPLFRGMIPSGIAVSEHTEANLPDVRIPRHLLTRAAMNLVTNAVEALGRSAANRRDATPRIAFDIRTEGPASIRISVADNGPGITEAVRHRAADPFYTTKTRSLSTGLGLSVARGVARMAGGALELKASGTGGVEAVLQIPGHEKRTPPTAGTPGIPSVSVEIPDQRSAAICVAVLASLPCVVTHNRAVADLVVTLADTGTAPPRSAPTVDPRIVPVDPSAGIAAMQRTLLRAFENWKQQP